ncbi:hypothetical protein NEDG_01345 [Nematocida displodere]|uniref:Uncharacterized protein n=1 Tax=Nematocida displodere TaxID=1805483 RepID=A0A177EDN2_9MICR|nr:hypothetical protein NEDG_01345 [Nematocida displodere]
MFTLKHACITFATLTVGTLGLLKYMYAPLSDTTSNQGRRGTPTPLERNGVEERRRKHLGILLATAVVFGGIFGGCLITLLYRQVSALPEHTMVVGEGKSCFVPARAAPSTPDQAFLAPMEEIETVHYSDVACPPVSIAPESPIHQGRGLEVGAPVNEELTPEIAAITNKLTPEIAAIANKLTPEIAAIANKLNSELDLHPPTEAAPNVVADTLTILPDILSLVEEHILPITKSSPIPDTTTDATPIPVLGL